MAYDPVKAHEYYMKHRQLKGRKKAQKPKNLYAKKSKGSKKKATSKNRFNTDNLNADGMSAYNEAKAKNTVEKKDFTKKLNDEMKKKIADLKKQLAGMSDSDKEVAIEKIRQQYKDIKSKATQYFKEKLGRDMDAIKADKTKLK